MQAAGKGVQSIQSVSEIQITFNKKRKLSILAGQEEEEEP